MRHNILYLDDNEALTSVIADYLERHGYTVDCAHTVAEATALSAKVTYSLFIIDIRLSGGSLDGFEFACHLQEHSPWAPLMLFSACITPQVELDSARRRIKIVSKPKPLPHLKAIIDAYLEERYWRMAADAPAGEPTSTPELEAGVPAGSEVR